MRMRTGRTAGRVFCTSSNTHTMSGIGENDTEEVAHEMMLLDGDDKEGNTLASHSTGFNLL